MNNERLISKIVKEEVKEIKPIHAGVNNSSYLVNGKYVVRIKKKKEKFYSSRHEKEILYKIKNLNLSEELVHLDLKGNKVSKFIPNLKMFSALDNEIILSAMMLKKLHQSGIKTNIKFNPFKRYKFYRKHAKEKDFKHEKFILEKTNKLYRKYPLVLCHNDVVDNNMLYTKNRSYLIDYEFAGKNIYLFDLASFISENNITNKFKINLFLDSYGFNKEDKDDLDAMMMFLNLLWYYWAKERYQATHKKIFSEIIKIKKAHIIQDMRSIKK